MNAEIQRPRIDLNAIAEAYDYNPLPEGYVPPERIDLGIDWEKLELDLIEKVRESAQKFPDVKTRTVQERNHPIIVCLFEALLGEDLILTFSKVSATTSDFDGSALKICLSIGDPDENPVGVFDVVQKGSTWELEHRLVEIPYRGQNIGGKMLYFLESFIAEYGKVAKRRQRCVINASQLDVLDYFGGKGFDPIQEEKEAFEETLKCLLRGDPKFCLKTRDKDFTNRVNGKGNETWYVFEEYYKDQVVTSDDCQNNSERFTLEKIIEPKAVEEVVTSVVGKVGRAS